MSSEVKTYFIQAESGGPVKIGKAKDPARRLKELQTSHYDRLRILATIEGDCERELHRQLKQHRMTGEWFAPHSDVGKVVRKVSGYKLDPVARPRIVSPVEDVLRYIGRSEWIPSSQFFQQVWDRASEFIDADDSWHDPKRRACDCDRCEVRRALKDISENVELDGAIWIPGHLILAISPDALGDVADLLEFTTETYWAFDYAGVGLEFLFVDQWGAWVYVDPFAVLYSILPIQHELSATHAYELWAEQICEAMRTPGCSILTPRSLERPIPTTEEDESIAASTKAGAAS